MRDFIKVAGDLAGMSQNQEFTDKINKIKEDAAFTAPEYRWAIRGEQLSDAFQTFAQEHNEEAHEKWFLNMVVTLSDNTMTAGDALALVDSMK